MAQNTNQQGPSPEQQMQQTLKASHGVATQAANAHSQGLAKLMGAIQAMHDHSMTPPPQAAGMMPGQDQGGGGDPEQAVWSAFPSTDPSSVDRMIQQAGSLEAAFPALAHMLEQDHQSLTDKWLEAVSQRLGQPAGQPDTGAAPQNPGVGGEATAY